MRFLTGLLVVIALGYAAYCGILAVGTYFQVAQLVDDAVLDLKPGLIENVQQALSGDRLSPASRLREAILEKITKARLPITADDVSVGDDQQRLHVKVKWTQPVIIYQDAVVFSVPLSLTRAFGPERLGG